MCADAAGIAEASRRILAGEPVAVPTETVYGLAADATNPTAVASIYKAKGRPSFNPLIVHVADLAAAEAIGVFDAKARQIAQTYWPGPLTLIVPARSASGIAPEVVAGLLTIAIRVPSHVVMRTLLEAVRRPLAAPSANASGRISPTSAGHVLQTLSGRIGMVLDDGATEDGLESTIVDATSWTILRPGPITREMLGGVINGEGLEVKSVSAPGMLPSHYAPRKSVRLEADTAQANEWLIGFGSVNGHATLSQSGNLAEAAANLFACLHEADRQSRGVIAIAPIPHHGLGIAINDRLRRAAATRE